MFIKYSFILFILVSITTCQTSKNDQVKSDLSISSTPTVSPTPTPDASNQELPADTKSGSIKNTNGVVSFNDKRESDGSKDVVRLYNGAGSLWYEFSYYDDHPSKFDGSNKDFAPFSFHFDYFILALKCVREHVDRYEVVVNEKNGLKKFVRKDDPILKLYTWEQHILNLFSVGNDDSNPVFSEPNLNAKKMHVPKHTFLHPDKIVGNWLRVKLGDSESEENDRTKVKPKDRFGWIRWKDKGDLIIQFYYIF